MRSRASLPGADELFRVTSVDQGRAVRDPRRPAAKEAQPAGPAAQPQAADATPAGRASSGRQRHDEKVTFYCTAQELMDLEHARLALRREHGVAVDRGRIVREALALVLSDLDHQGADSALVRRLRA
jgi:hypothetical protein